MNLTYIILVIFALLGLLFGLLQFWFWTVKQKEIKEEKKLLKELTDNNSPKLTKEEQFSFVDGNCDWTKFGEKEIPFSVLDYFIDIEPDDYLEHLKKNNPPTSWQEDTYGEVEIKKLHNGYQIIYYDHGKEISTEYFDSYEQLLRYLVYYRLTNIGNKYKKQIKKSYYA
jgi:hypothetical protein